MLLTNTHHVLKTDDEIMEAASQKKKTQSKRKQSLLVLRVKLNINSDKKKRPETNRNRVNIHMTKIKNVYKNIILFKLYLTLIPPLVNHHFVHSLTLK